MRGRSAGPRRRGVVAEAAAVEAAAPSLWSPAGGSGVRLVCEGALRAVRRRRREVRAGGGGCVADAAGEMMGRARGLVPLVAEVVRWRIWALSLCGVCACAHEHGGEHGRGGGVGRYPHVNRVECVRAVSARALARVWWSGGLDRTRTAGHVEAAAVCVERARGGRVYCAGRGRARWGGEMGERGGLCVCSIQLLYKILL